MLKKGLSLLLVRILMLSDVFSLSDAFDMYSSLEETWYCPSKFLLAPGCFIWINDSLIKYLDDCLFFGVCSEAEFYKKLYEYHFGVSK